MGRLHWVFFLSILIVTGPALAQVSYPTCNAGWEWSYNSKGQNPCNVAAYLEASCNSGQFNVPTLTSGRQYAGPNTQEHYPCQCNTVVYSLVSACAACQGSSWILWSAWNTNCPTVALSTYPRSIPGGTSVPHWAYLDVATANNWSEDAAQSAGDSPESTPNAPSIVQPSSTASAAPSNQNNSSAGKIAGAVVAGVVGTALLLAFIFWYRRRLRLRAEPRLSPFAGKVEAFGMLQPDTSMSTGKYYDPSDPSTFPKPFVSPSASVLQTTASTEQIHSTKATIQSDKSRYTGLPLV